MNMVSPILVTGCPRSGASMIARVFELCGVRTGMTTNLMEHSIVREMEESYMDRFGYDPMGQYPLPEIDKMMIPANWREEVSVHFVKYPKWQYKSSLISLLYPVWHNAFPNAKWIIVRRRSADIIQSCIKTGFMVAFKDKTNQLKVNADDERAGWLWLIHQYEQCFVNMITTGINCKVIWPERMVHGDYSQLYETLEWLGLSWKSEILNLIDPLLWHSRKRQAKTEKIWQQE